MTDPADRRAFVLSCGFVATGPKHSDRALAQIALIDIKSRRLVKETVALDITNPTCGPRGDSQQSAVHKAGQTPIASCLQPLTGIALRDVETAPPFAVVFARVKRLLGPKVLIVGQSVRPAASLLGLIEGVDFERLCDFDEMFSYCDPFFASRSYFDLHHLAEVADLSVEYQGATGDASIMAALYAQFSDSYRIEGELEPTDPDRENTAIQQFRSKALQSPPSPSLAEKIGFRYDGVCLTPFPSRCSCFPGAAAPPVPSPPLDVAPPVLGSVVERSVTKPRRGRSKGTEYRQATTPELVAPAPAPTVPSKQTPPRRPTSKAAAVAGRTPPANVPVHQSPTVPQPTTSAHSLSAQATPFSPASASAKVLVPPPMFPPPPVPWFPPAMLPGMMPMTGAVTSQHPQTQQQLAQFFQQYHEQTLLAFQQFQRAQLHAQPASGPPQGGAAPHAFRSGVRGRAGAPLAPVEGFVVSAPGAPQQHHEADPHSESLAQVLDFLSEAPTPSTVAPTAPPSDNSFWYPLHDSLFTPSTDDARHPRPGRGGSDPGQAEPRASHPNPPGSPPW